MEERATVNSIVNLASWASRGLGTAIWGSLTAFGLDLPGYISTAFSSVSADIFYIVNRKGFHPGGGVRARRTR